MESWSLLLEIVILLAACLLAGGICSALKQNPLVGYLLAGMLLGGPGSFNVVRSAAHIEAIAELGVALLLFSLGLEFSWNRLVGLGAKTLSSGAVQVVLTAVAAGLIALLFGVTGVEAVAIGAMVSLSSTATVLRVLVDRGEIDGYSGRNSLAILLVQDMAVVPLAVLMTLLAGGGDARDVTLDVMKLLGLAAALVLGFYLLINQAAVRALRILSIEKNRELTILLAVVIGFGATWGAHAVGLSPALGAFLAGMFLGSSPFATQVRADVSSLRVVLVTLFFGAVGMVADPLWIGSHLPLVLGIALLMVVGKAVIVWGILRMIGQPDGVSLATGLCLAQVGEFAFVLGKTARSGNVIGEELYMLIVSVAIVTLFLTPYLIAAAPFAAVTLQRWRRIPTRAGNDVPRETFQPEVVIVGFGPAGQAVGRAFVGGSRRVLIIDLNSAAKKAAESLGLHAEIGDATNVEVLEHAGVSAASVVAITLPARAAALTVLQHVRSLNSTARIIVRSRYQLHQSDFEQAGADRVFGDEAEVGKQLAEAVTGHLPIEPHSE